MFLLPLAYLSGLFRMFIKSPVRFALGDRSCLVCRPWHRYVRIFTGAGSTDLRQPYG